MRTAVVHSQKRGWRPQTRLDLPRVPVVVEVDALSLCPDTDCT